MQPPGLLDKPEMAESFKVAKLRLASDLRLISRPGPAWPRNVEFQRLPVSPVSS
jgi:hypothetical protein